MSVQGVDIILQNAQEASAGKLVVLHYYVKKGTLTACENVAFSSMEALIDFFRPYVADRYLYDDQYWELSRRYVEPGTYHQNAKESFRFFNREQFDFAKSVLYGGITY